MKDFLSYFEGKKILILGFGLEGTSTYKTIRKFLPNITLSIADKRDDLSDKVKLAIKNDELVKCYSGNDYLDGLNNYDIVIKSPGISFKNINVEKSTQITSQTEIFINLFKQKIIGITGTKGKSTTTSLLYHILKTAGKNSILAGNMGLPPFDYISDIKEDSIIAFEMSSHQLENIKVSPHISILLNIFQEHLDHYNGYKEYQEAKFNIVRWQSKGDYFIVNRNNEAIKNTSEELFGDGSKLYLNDNNGVICNYNDLIIKLNGQKIILENVCKNRQLQGEHNLINIQAASAAALLAGIEVKHIIDGVANFKGLSHRLEMVANIKGAVFINDSISTIPEAAIAALETFPNTSTIILGGFDRGVFYDNLIEYLCGNNVKNLIFIGDAGKRMYNILISKYPLNTKNSMLLASFEDAVNTAKKLTNSGEVCLLSPAAASYDSFKNFMERGDYFRLLLNK
ncbi:MAG: UDP-N-acetylmuramoyl-L-alanine--D-glutamate ligase [Bacteroidetes bacterium]|nr:UDP-N-acetylmuramoyl-L-alanine--D-glutamate ligase [Bacteroidota bacterium]